MAKLVVLVLSACFCLAVIGAILIPAITGLSMLGWLVRESRLSLRLSSDRFRIAVLEAKPESNGFVERVRVQCEGDMEIGVWVTDLKDVGFAEITGSRGDVYYQERHPRKAGGSERVRADGKYSACEVLFRVRTTADNTAWHSEVAGASLDTKLSAPLTVSSVRMSWPDSYGRGSEIPLANLGEYKVLLSVR